METADAGSSQNKSSFLLEAVFLHFLGKFQGLPIPRSVAEAGITDQELGGLTHWLLENWKWAHLWCESTCQEDLDGGISASRQEMLGSLLLIVASEACRDKSGEDSVWPTVTGVSNADEDILSALFVTGQQSAACKDSIAAGVRRLDLRNLIGGNGPQEYIDTVKLQYGFTLREALDMLPEWLDRLEPPIAVRILDGRESEYADLKSASFITLWRALVYFRRGLRSKEQTAAVLNASPWIRPPWIPELLRTAKLRHIGAFSLSSIVDRLG